MRASGAWATRTRGAAMVAVLAATLAGCGGHAKTPTPDKAPSADKAPARSAASYSTLVDAGIHLLRAGNLSAAQQLFGQAIVKAPQAPLAYYNLALVDQQIGRQGPALSEYRRVLAIDPRYVPAIFNMAVLLGPTQPMLAINLYRRAIRLQPAAPTAFLNMGLLKVRERSSRAAGLADLRRALRLDPVLEVRIPASLRAELQRKKG